MHNRVQLPKLDYELQAATTQAASYTPGLVNLKLGGYKELIVTLDITSAERDSSDELYDVYIVSGDGVSSWDIAHFPQIATTGAKRYTARILSSRLAEVTTATPGVSAEPSSILATVTSGSGEGTKTLAAGKVRHGPFGDWLAAYLVVAGTVVTGIVYSVEIQAAG